MNGIGLISLWIKDIVILFTLISIAELVMPKGNMKRYIELVIGILIMFTIISPFAKLMRYDFKFNNSIYNYTREQEKIKNEDGFYISQEETIKSLVIEKIKGEVLQIIMENTDYIVLNIDIDLEIHRDKEEIRYINLMLGNKEIEEDDDRISIDNVSTVKINQNSNGELLEKSTNEDKKYNKLKNLIGQRFSIDSEKVIIKSTEQ